MREVLTEPMFLMLLAAGGTYLALGDRGEALFLLGSVLVVIGITLTQERKTQRALESLRELSAPRALVLRDGVERRIARREVVRGDLLVLRDARPHRRRRAAAQRPAGGGRVAADGRIRAGGQAAAVRWSPGRRGS